MNKFYAAYTVYIQSYVRSSKSSDIGSHGYLYVCGIDVEIMQLMEIINFLFFFEKEKKGGRMHNEPYMYVCVCVC